MASVKQQIQGALQEYEQRQAAAQSYIPQSSIPGVQSALAEYRYRTALDQDTYDRYSAGSKYVSNFLRDANSFFNRAEQDFPEDKAGFNAAEFFAERQKQADALKARREEASHYLEDVRDAYSYADYLDIKDYLSAFDTQIDDVLGHYEDANNAKAGMRAYEDEMLAAMEQQQKKQAIWDNFMPDITNPAYGIMSLFRPTADQSDRAVTDQWTAEQRYTLGGLQNQDPEEAIRYARSINSGVDPNQQYLTQQQREHEMMSADLSALQREIADLNAQHDNYQYDASTFRGRMGAEADLQRLEQEISDKEQYYNQAKRLQDAARMAAVAGNTDFADRSGYVSTNRPGISPEDVTGGYTDLVYEYINGNETVQDYFHKNRRAEATLFDQLAPEEIAIYNYYHATEGKETAEEYLHSIEGALNERRGLEIGELLKDQPFRAMMFGGVAGLDAAFNNTVNLFNFSGEYREPSAYQYAAGAVREDLADTGPRLPEFLGGASLGQVGFDLVNTAANMAPSMAFGALAGPAAGAALMGASAAGGAYQEALNSGYSKEQARTYSALVGGSEAGLEYLLGGISSLGGMVPDGVVNEILKGVDNAFARFAIEMGGSMVSEGFEEGLQEVLTPWFKNLALRADEDVNWNEVAYSSLLGALSGGVMEGPGTAANAVSYAMNRGRSGSSSAGTADVMPAAAVAQDGKAKQISTDTNVDVLDFDSVKDGKATIQLTDGGTAAYEDVLFANEQQANQFRTVLSLPGIDTMSANEALHAVMDNDGGGDIDSIVGIRDAYGKGYIGVDKTYLSQGDSASLPNALRNTLYDIGNAQRAAREVAPTTRAAQTQATEGYKRVVLEGKDANTELTAKQDAEVRFMDYIAENFSGTTVHVYKSYKRRDGKFYYRDSNGKEHKAPNGIYKNDEIWVDLNAGNNGEGLALNTFAHEMYHHVKKWSPKKANELGQFIVKELGLESAEAAVAEQIKKARKAGLSESYFVSQGMTQEQAANRVEQNAWEDFIADSLETMFTQGDPAKAIADLKQENRGLFDEIKKFVDKWVSKLKAFYSDKTISQEGEMVAQLESFEKIQKLFMEAMEDAGKNFAAAEVLTPGEDGFVVNEDGDPVAMVTEDGSAMLSIRTYEEDGRKVYRDYLNKLVNGNKMTREDADSMMADLESIYEICKEFKDKYAPFSKWSDAEVVRDTYGRPVFSVVTPNGEYKMNLDFSLVCKKRRTLDAVFNEMAKRGIIDDFELGQKSVVKINEIIRKYKFETACALCFVDAKRFRQASMADSFVSLYNELVESLVPENQRESISHFNFAGYETIPKRNGIDKWSNDQLDFSHLDDVMKRYGKGTVEHKAAKYIKSNPDGRRLLLRGDFMSSKGFDAVKTQNRQILKLYNSKKGTGGPKAAFGDVQYLNEVVRKAKGWTPEKAFAVGGVRVQSFSDYVPRLVFDYVQMIYDLAATKLPAHAYTKESLFVKQFGMTGIKINMSLIPAIAEDGVAPGLDANGNYVWAGESFDYDTAVEIQNTDGYTDNCGTICVGVSKEHIEKLLADPNIRMVIPYHKSGLNPIVAHMNKISQFKDYTGEQNTTKDGSKVKKDFDFNKELHSMGADGNPKAVADKYLKWCAANGYTPKFREFAMDENYYKLLIDFTVYNKDGKYVPQQAVNAVFPGEGAVFGTMKDLIKSGLEEDAIVEGRRESKLPNIVDEIEKSLPRTEAEIEDVEVAQATGDLEDNHSKYSYENLPASAFYENGEIYRYEFLVAQDDMRVTDKLPDLKNLQTNGKIDAEKVVEAGFNNVLESGGKKTGNTYQITNAYTGRSLQIGKTSITHGLGNNINSLRTNARLGAVIGELCKNAIPLNGVPNTHNVRGTYVMATLVNTKVNNKDMNMVALITVEQQNGKVQSVDFVDVAHAVSGRLVRDIEKENRSAQGTPPGTKSEWVTRFSTIKISDFLDIVNRTHQGYLSDDVISALNVERRGERKGLFSLRNEEVDNSPRGILMRLDVKSRKLDAEKYHLSRYQERVEKLAEQEARLKDANAKIEELSSDKVKNKDAIRELQSEARNAQLQINMYNRQLRDAEKTDMFRKMVADGRLQEYRAEQREAEKARILEYRAMRNEITGMNDVMSVMEDEFVRLAKDLEDKKIDLKTMEAEFLRLAKEYDNQGKTASEAKQLKEDNAIWQREYRRLMREYETSGRKIERLEATIARQRATAKARVQSRRNTELRHKIQKKASELNNLLLHGSKHRNIPEYLQPAVAEILDAINMEMRDGDARRKTYEATLLRYDQRIAAETDPTKVSELIEKRNAYAAKGDQFAGRVAKLKNAYDNIRKNKIPGLEIDEGLSDLLDTLFERVGDTPLGQMTSAQLEAVNDVLKITKATIVEANKLFQEGQRAGVDENSQSAMAEVRSAGGVHKLTLPVIGTVMEFSWNNLKPVYAMETIGSKVLKDLYENVRRGEDTLGRNLAEAKTFFQKQWKEYGGKDWDMEKKHSFESTSGKEFQLDLNQIMSIYALSKRDQARSHLRNGGFSFESRYKTKEDVKLGPVTLKVGMESTDASAYNLSDEILGEIISKLSPQQRAFVDKMQGYLSNEMAAKGNEVSLKKYGIRLFKEQNYFPLRVADQYMAKKREQQTGDRKLKNSGFTKEVTPEAKNPVVLGGFLDVWGEHVDEMSMYNAFVLPLDDFERVLNYHSQFTENGEATSVVEAIRNAYGEGATQYLDKLIRDINGGARTDSVAKSINRMTSKAKKAQTMASLSVAIQQPSAVIRAMAMVDGKYFIGPKVTEMNHRRTWDEMKKYAPITIIKEMGGFDTNVGQSTVEYLTDRTEYNGFLEKAEGFIKDEKYRDEVLGWLPGYMDELAWGAIWNAVKREQREIHPDMNHSGDAFLRIVSERFTDVITHTQVYDSVFSRSGMMRSKDTAVKMVTSFMAEPTTTANMLYSALVNAKRGGSKAQSARTVAALAGALVLNSALVSLVYAMRDDEEDKRYDEKWIENFRENVLEGLNPATYIPIIRDINSMRQGFDIERSDMSLYGDLMNAINGLTDENRSAWEKVETVMGATGNLLGIPVKNIIRDGKGLFNTIGNAMDHDDPATRTGRAMAWKGEDLKDGEQLLLAIQRGDEAHIQRVAGRFESQRKAESALQSAIREEYVSGKITAEEATRLLTENFDREDESDVYWILEDWNYARENGSSEGYTKMGSLMAAVESGENLDAEIRRYLANGVESSSIKSQIGKVYRQRYLEGDEEARTQIGETVRRAYLQLGETDADVDDRLKGWKFEAQYGMTYSDMKSGYREGDVTERELREAMKFYGRKNFEIEADIRSLNEEIAFADRFNMSLSEMYDAYDAGDVSRNTLISALEFRGSTREEAREAVNRRDIGNRLGIDYMNLDDAYKHGDISRQTFYNAMVENGATREEADEAIIGYDWLKKHVRKYPDLAISDAKKFAVRISSDVPDVTLEDYGVSIDAYLEYTRKRPECKGVDANGDGKTDSGTLRDSVFRMIDSLPISDEAKTGLALMSYSMNSIRKNAPWA